MTFFARGSRSVEQKDTWVAKPQSIKAVSRGREALAISDAKPAGWQIN